MKKLFSIIITVLMVCAAFSGCASKNGTAEGTVPPEELSTPAAEALCTYTPEPASADPTEAITPEPTEAPTPEPTEVPTPEPPEPFVFRPKVRSAYMEEVFGVTMCDTWDNIVDAVMAGENTFACPDKHTYDWSWASSPFGTSPCSWS